MKIDHTMSKVQPAPEADVGQVYLSRPDGEPHILALVDNTHYRFISLRTGIEKKDTANVRKRGLNMEAWILAEEATLMLHR